MRRVRSRLSLLAVLTLTAQIAVMAVASTALCCGTADTAADTTMPCCKDGKAHVCPLKKAPANPDAPRLKSCCSADQQALAALFGLTGVPEAPASAVPGLMASETFATATEQPVALVRPPDSPPPRA